MSNYGVWTHRCRKCPHIQSEHTVAEGGEIPDGPWRCLRCDCVVSRDDVIGYAMDRYEFEEYVAEFGTRDELIESVVGGSAAAVRGEGAPTREGGDGRPSGCTPSPHPPGGAE